MTQAKSVSAVPSMTPDGAGVQEPRGTSSEPDGALALALAVREGKWPHTMDAQVWEQEFNKALAAQGIQPIDPGWIIGWFANAIMAGYDTANARRSPAAALTAPDVGVLTADDATLVLRALERVEMHTSWRVGDIKSALRAIADGRHVAIDAALQRSWTTPTEQQETSRG